MVDAFAAPEAPQDARLLVMALLGFEDGNRLPDHLLGLVTEQPPRRLIPAEDHTVEILADDRIVRGFHDRRQPQGGCLRALGLGEVDQHVYAADDPARCIVKWRGERHEWHPSAVWPLGQRLHAT